MIFVPGFSVAASESWKALELPVQEALFDHIELLLKNESLIRFRGEAGFYDFTVEHAGSVHYVFVTVAIDRLLNQFLVKSIGHVVRLKV